MGRHRDDSESSSSDDSRSRDREARKRRKRKEKRKRRRNDSSVDSGSDDGSSGGSDGGDARHRKRHRKRDRDDKRSAKKNKKKSRRSRERGGDGDHGDSAATTRSVVLADALCRLLAAHPGLAEDLPLILIRLGGGAAVDLSQMTDAGAAAGLGAVLGALRPLGLAPDDATGAWQWTGPRSDLVLLRAVRALLDDVGLNEEAVARYEAAAAEAAEPQGRTHSVMRPPPPVPAAPGAGRHARPGLLARPEDYAGQRNPAAADDDSSDDEGPAPFGATPAAPAAATAAAGAVAAAAAARARELAYVRSGVAPPPEGAGGTAREEWMVDPGQYDFLGKVAAGNPMRARGFQAAGAASGAVATATAAAPVRPEVQAEIDAIMQAHEDSRGPSLMELHRQRRAQEAASAAAAGGGGRKGHGTWKWDRDTDLSAGRNVDRANLSAVLGGAGTDLKQKFHKGT